MDPSCEFPFTKNYEAFLKSPITVPGRKTDVPGAVTAIATFFSQGQEECFGTSAGVSAGTSEADIDGLVERP
jgi:hypothetical protein